jgi:hypothetical protein
MSTSVKPEPTVSDPIGSEEDSLFEHVKSYLDRNDWQHTAYPDASVFKMGCRLQDCSVTIILTTRENQDVCRLSCYSSYPVNVPDDLRFRVADAITRINFTLSSGTFEMDHRDGELCVRMTLDSEQPPSDRMIDRLLQYNLMLADEYFKPLMAVIFGSATPETMVAVATRRVGETLQ